MNKPVISDVYHVKSALAALSSAKKVMDAGHPPEINSPWHQVSNAIGVAMFHLHREVEEDAALGAKK